MLYAEAQVAAWSCMRLSPCLGGGPPGPAPALAREALGCCRNEEPRASIAGRALRGLIKGPCGVLVDALAPHSMPDYYYE